MDYKELTIRYESLDKRFEISAKIVSELNDAHKDLDRRWHDELRRIDADLVRLKTELENVKENAEWWGNRGSAVFVGLVIALASAVAGYFLRSLK